ncbi:transcriptional regulator, RpiR family [Cribrihabitans marinus]|uniref:Transcriptional regulator, RpiR family n=1 Tax=Cribrihabitans marinus TaxID=1227549 RepID=A0A1H6YX11_9RHOB|nr:MurR/RpiR family transcriptional regulator [Cribrihabitans marinus]GGH29446.1 transcriptional regulator [Cribrihabitans marinus]SEJ41912.1 transcriptional regulator, RpiR family [Cribrihabitans marinus]
MQPTFEQRLAENYETLSGTLRQAADYLSANPVNVASRSLRTVSRESGVSPAAFSRLARALDYAGFEDLREELRAKIDRRVNDFAGRAQRLQRDHGSDQAGFLDAHLEACQSNLGRLAHDIDRDMLSEVVDSLINARHVVLLGALGSTGIVEYLSYMASFCADNWSMLSRMGSSLGGGLTGLDKRDVVIVVTKPPFATRAIRAAQIARQQGTYVVLITDTHSCPALRHASAWFVVPTTSPHFYSSYVATLFLVETLIGMFVSRAGDGAKDRIAEVDKKNRLLAETWDG